MEIWMLLVIAVVVAVIAKAWADARVDPSKFCSTCGYEGTPKRVTKGHFLLELVLWLCFIVPGLIYSIWRITSKQNVCASCGATTLMPPNSPVAVATKQRLNESRAPV